MIKITKEQLAKIIAEEVVDYLNERCQKGYKTHPTRKTKKMYGKTYRNCIKAEQQELSEEEALEEKNNFARSAVLNNPQNDTRLIGVDQKPQTPMQIIGDDSKWNCDN